MVNFHCVENLQFRILDLLKICLPDAALLIFLQTGFKYRLYIFRYILINIYILWSNFLLIKPNNFMRPALIVKSNSSFSVVRKSIGFLAAIASLHVIMGFTFSNMHSSNSTFLEMLFYASIVWVPMLIIYVLVFISIRKRMMKTIKA